MTISIGSLPPRRRPDLVVRAVNGNGRFVAKDLRSGQFFELGEQEAFLLEHLDGKQSPSSICAAFEQRFREPLTIEELDEFVTLARARGFLQTSTSVPPQAAATSPPPRPVPPIAPASTNETGLTEARKTRNLLFWRVKLFDPDRLFSWLVHPLSFFWTRSFLVVSALSISAAVVLVTLNWHELVSHFARAWQWQTIALAWLTMLLVTTCHEFAHGLTCKRYGGEVHDIGFVSILFLPGFYCNVSDAWLFPKKSQRLLVTFAGGYFELFLWSLAVFVWQLTVLDSLANYLAWIVVTIAGVRVLFNFNPFLKLDGYYLLSDATEITNLRQRSWLYVAASLRWMLWGAARPGRESRSRFLLIYGITSWCFALGLLGLLTYSAAHWAADRVGMPAAVGVVLIGAVAMRGLFSGLTQGELRSMLRGRPGRTTVWLTGLGAIVAGMFLIHIEDRVGGTFQLRPRARTELRAPVAGFLRVVQFREGDPVEQDAIVVRLDIPDLSSRISQKQAEVAEAEANLRLLEAGTRPEEVEEQVQRVERATAIRDLARKELEQSRLALQQDLARLDQAIAQYQTELSYAEEALRRSEELYRRQVLSRDDFQASQKKRDVAYAQWQQVLAEKRVRAALGTMQAEAQLAKSEDELANAQSELSLMELGNRPQEIDAASAKVARLREELAYLEGLERKLAIRSPVAGVVVTPRLNEQVGRYYLEGELICEIEDPSVLEAEIRLNEREVVRVERGDRVVLKARALPFDEFESRLDRIAPRAAADQVHSTVTVYCQVHNERNVLRPQMQGYARIYGPRRPVGEILAERALGLIRTQFWW